MKKTFISLIVGIGMAATAQLTMFTNIIYQQAPVPVGSNVVLQGFTFTNAADLLAVGQQFGNITNAAGIKLFLPQYFTNRNFTISVSMSNSGTMIPQVISIGASSGFSIQP